MKLVKLISILGILAMTTVLVNGFTSGDFFGEGSQLFAIPWGVVSLVAFAGSLYTFIALQTCGNNWCKFWMGNHA